MCVEEGFGEGVEAAEEFEHVVEAFVVGADVVGGVGVFGGREAVADVEEGGDDGVEFTFFSFAGDGFDHGPDVCFGVEVFLAVAAFVGAVDDAPVGE